MYHFEQRKNRYHLVFDDEPAYDLMDGFLQVEGVNFDDVIAHVLLLYIDTQRPQTFAGNVYAIAINDTTVLIEDTLGNIEETIPTELFLKIFSDWLKLIRPSKKED